MNETPIVQALAALATAHPDRRAFAGEGEASRWGEVLRRVASMAGGLRAAGLNPGDHAATLALNSPRHFELLLAVWWAGGVLVPLNTRLANDELRFILAHSRASMLVVDDNFRDFGQAIAAAADGPEPVLTLDEALHGHLAASEPIPAFAADPTALAALMYTGGTTGLPKGVELTHRNFAAAAANMRRDLAHDEHTVYLHAAPMFHLADLGIGLAVSLAGGGHGFMARFTPEDFYRRLARDGITHLQLVPTMLAAVLDAPCRDDALLARVRRISYGAAPISAALLQRVLDAFPNAGIHQFYGMTESCGACVMLPPERHVLAGPLAGKLGAAGTATEGFEIRIVDGHGQLLPAGQVGEIQIRGVPVMRGYWNDPAQTQATLKDGWLGSGDGGYLDDEGFLFVVDRIKDMIISGGENIYCAEVESAIAGHPAVRECAVIGLPDDHWGERVHAVVVARAGFALDREALDAHCRARLAGYKVPRSYDFAESLPLSGVGKVQKKALREAHLQRSAAR
jgi:long-chain acyl-CoA synthetase